MSKKLRDLLRQPHILTSALGQLELFCHLSLVEREIRFFFLKKDICIAMR